MTFARLMAVVAALLHPAPRVAPAPRLVLTGAAHTGQAYHYHPYPDPYGRSMRQVAARRGMRLDPAVDGYASTRDCGAIGRRLVAVIAGHRVVLQQIDCSNKGDWALQDALGDVVEVDWSLAHAQGWATYGGGGLGRAPATVRGYLPREEPAR
jgi:hypothetical protein